LLTEADANGNTTYYNYDALDHRVGMVSAEGVYTTWTYDANGNKISQTVYNTKVAIPTPGSVPSVTLDANNDRTTTYGYDLMGRLTSTTITSITTGSYNTTTSQYTVITGNITIATAYDALGNVIKQTDANGNISRTYYNNAGQIVGQVDNLGYLTTWTRDAYGNITDERRYATKLTSFTISDSTTLSTIAAAYSTSLDDRVTDTTYDGLNRVVSTTLHGVVSGTTNATTGALSTATADAITSYQYDGLNDVTQKTDAMSNATSWGYDNLGRQISQIDLSQSFNSTTGGTVNTGTVVHPETDTKYNGLSEVMRTTVLGVDTAGADSHITLYTYGPGGRLASEQDATGAVTQYGYDANGNVTQKTLKNRVDANGVMTDDITYYSYDAMNRQTLNKDMGTGLISQVQYNSFNQITGKRSYVINTQTPTIPSAWQEVDAYDQAGRVWKSNSGDGVVKVYVSDANGNATLSISGTLDISNMKLSDVLAQHDLDTQNNVVQQTQYTYSVFDAKNQLIDTIQADMASNHEQVIQVGNSSINASVDPVTAGAITGGYGTVSWSGSYSAGVAPTQYATAAAGSASINVVVPATLGLTGNVRVEITATLNTPARTAEYASSPATSITSTQTTVLTGTQITATASYNMGVPPINTDGNSYISNLTIRITKITAQGDVVLANQAWSGVILGGGNAGGQYTNPNPGITSNSGSVATPKRIILSGQPPTATALYVAYRPMGSLTGYTYLTATRMTNSTGAAMAGMFAFDYSALAAQNYEMQYFALDANGNTLNKQSGSFNVTNSAAPTATQNVGALGNIGGAGRGLIGANGNLSFLEQGNATVGLATTGTLRYRIKGSNSGWTPIALSSSMPGWLYVPWNVFAASTTYELDIVSKNAAGAEVNRAYADFSRDASGNSSIGAFTTYSAQPAYVSFTEKTSTQYITVSYRTAGSTNPFSTPISVAATNAGSGIFTWDANSLVADPLNNYDYDVIVKAYDAGDVINNQAEVTLRLGVDTAVEPDQNIQVVPSANTSGVGQVLLTPPTVTINGNSIIKSGGTDATWGDADAYSTTSFTGGAYVSAQAGQTTLGGMFGLNSDPTTDKNYTSIDYAWQTTVNGTLTIYENGVVAAGGASFGTYTTTDILSVVYDGNTVRYLKNGVVLRSVATTAGRTFYFDSSLYSSGYALNNIQFGATTALTTMATTQAVTIAGNSITKTGGLDAWNADAYSANSLTGGAYASAQAGQVNLNGMFGLNSDPTTDKSYASLDYAWQTTVSGTLNIYENGTLIGAFGTYTTSDILSVVYAGSTVRYLKNGVVQRTVATTAGRVFYFDSSLKSIGYTLNNIQFGASPLTGGGATVTNNGNSIIKSGGTDSTWGDADIYSSVGLTGSAYVSAQAGQTTLSGMFGLNTDPTTDKSYTSLDYAWYPTPSGVLKIYENGVNVGYAGTYTTSDILSIAYSGNTVSYLKNGFVQRTVNATAGQTFYFDSSFYSSNYVLNNIKVGTSATDPQFTPNLISNLPIPAVTINGNSIIKSGGTDATWGDADAYSTTSFTGGAYVSAQAGQTTLGGMFGLNSDPTTDKNYTSIDYAWQTTVNGTLTIYENGVVAAGGASFGTYTTTDILSVVYDGNTVRYLKNGVVLRSVATTAGRTFYFDSSLYSSGYALNNIQFGATPLGPSSAGGSINITGQGNATVGLATSLIVNYRVKDSGSSWTPLTLTPNVVSGVLTPGAFTLDWANFPIGTTYEFDIVASNASGAEVNRASAVFTRDTAGNPSMTPLAVYTGNINLTEKFSTQYIMVSYRLVGSTAGYSSPIRIDPTAPGSGQFNWNARDLIDSPLNNYDYDVITNAYDAGGLLNNQTDATVRLGANSSILSSTNSNSNTDTQVMRVMVTASAPTPQVSTTDSLGVTVSASATNASVPTTQVSTIGSLEVTVLSASGNNTPTYPGMTSGEVGNNGAFAIIKADGSVVTWGNSVTGGDSSAVASQLNGTIKTVQVYSNADAFAALRADGSVVTWGASTYGGDSSAVASQLNGSVKVVQIYSTHDAFAALRADGSVVIWGINAVASYGNDIATLLESSNRVTQIYSNTYAFAALRADGSVVTWGNYDDASAVTAQLNGSVRVMSIMSTTSGFAALRADGSVVTWGSIGGDSSSVATQINGTNKVTQLYATSTAFAALRADGSVVTWGITGGNDSSTVAAQINGTNKVVQIYASNSAFAALRADGSVVTWGTSGGDSSAVAAQINGTNKVTQIYSNGNAFAALRADGSVVTWGVATWGGDSSTVASQLNGSNKVIKIYATLNAFAAVRADGSVVTWGNSTNGGDSSAVATQINGSDPVTQIVTSGYAFAAMRADGSVVTWGDSSNSGNTSLVSSQAVASQLSSGFTSVLDISNSTRATLLANMPLQAPVNTQYLTVSYRPYGSTGTYTVVNLTPTTPGLFVWQVSPLNSDYDVVIQAYDANDQLIGHQDARKLQINSDGSTVTLGAASQTDLVQLSYRPKGSTGSYINIPATIYDNGTTLEYRAELPTGSAALQAGDYEYAYTAYDANTPANLLGVSGIFTVAPTSLAQFVDTSPALTTGATVSIIEPINTQYINVSYRPYGSTDPYTMVTVNATAPGVFDWNLGGQGGTYDVVVKAYDANNQLLDLVSVKQFLVSVAGNATTVTAASASNSTGNAVNINSAGSVSKISGIHLKQSYNAFGEVIQEIDGNGNATDFTYNTLGKMLLKRDPKTDITLSNGFVQTASEATRPVTSYTYDLTGRLAAVTDANNNLNKQAYVNGTQEVSFERHADSGTVTRHYDIFGNLISETDENSHVTGYTYDAMNRVTKITRPSSNLDQYTYDAAGNRITHMNAAGNIEKTYYDSLGRVTKTTDFMGFATTYTYVYNNAILGVGGLSVGGWKKITTDAVGRIEADKTDAFGHLTAHTDLGGHTFVYNYNYAGWLTSQTGTSGQDIEYTYYANGYIQSIWDKAIGTYTRYEYDNNGNRTFEGYVTLKNPLSLLAGAQNYYEYSTITYDSLNRIKSIIDPQATISYEYDAVGNRRYVKSVYYNGVNGAIQSQEYWYSYDSMNRFLITMGSLALTSTGAATTRRGSSATDTSIMINQGAFGGAGVSISYDLTGQRKEAVYASDGHREDYRYGADGYLQSLYINTANAATQGALRSYRYNDSLGRTTTYNEYAADGTTVSYSRSSAYDKDSRVITESGTDGNTTYSYYTDNTDNASTASQTGAGQLADVTNSNGGTTTNTYYAYQYWDEAKQMAVTLQAYNPALKQNNSLWKPGYSDLSYDVNGHLSGAVDRVGNRSFTYVNDAQGQIMLRDEIAGGSVNRVERFYYVDGERVGDVSNDGPSLTDYVTALAQRGANKAAVKGNADKYANFKPIASADFDQNYEPISPIYPGSTSTSYTAHNGDTLQSIALTVWGDSSMWYLLADANGLDTTQMLKAGQVLTIPNKVTNIHNNSSTYQVYDPGQAMGDTSPTLPDAPPVPQPKHHGCGGIASILVMAVAIVATIYTAGALSPLIAAQGGAAAAGFGATMGAGVGVMGAGGLAAAGAAMVGSVAGQLTGMALGVQDNFSWVAVATAGITAGFGPPSIGDGVSTLSVAANAVASNVFAQGLNIITGQQKGFSWTGIAVSAIGAVAASKVNNSLFSNADGTPTSWVTDNPVMSAIAQGTIRSGAVQLTQMAITGGHLNWSAIASGGVSAGIYAAAGMASAPQGNVTLGDSATRLAQADLDYATANAPVPGMIGTSNQNGALALAPAAANATDEVVAAALARQREEQASNGGAVFNFVGSAGDAGVEYGPDQYSSLDDYAVHQGGLRGSVNDVANVGVRSSQKSNPSSQLQLGRNVNNNTYYAPQNTGDGNWQATPTWEAFKDANPRFNGLIKASNSLIGGFINDVNSDWLLDDAFYYATGQNRSVVTNKFEPQSESGKEIQDKGFLNFIEDRAVSTATALIRAPRDLIHGVYYGNSDEIGSGGAVAMRSALMAVGGKYAESVGANTAGTNITSLAAEDIRFSQNSVSFNKVDRVTGQSYTYSDLVESMKTNGWQGDPVDVVKMSDGQLTSMDNTRIAAAREAGINVQATVRNFDGALTSDIQNARGWGSYNTWGEAITARINNQSKNFGTLNLYGSPQLPRIKGQP
jgi:YD repeat-containing protein